jgi:hypothetical protein
MRVVVSAYWVPLIEAVRGVPSGTLAPSTVTEPQKLEGMGGAAKEALLLRSAKATASTKLKIVIFFMAIFPDMFEID